MKDIQPNSPRVVLINFVDPNTHQTSMEVADKKFSRPALIKTISEIRKSKRDAYKLQDRIKFLREFYLNKDGKR